MNSVIYAVRERSKPIVSISFIVTRDVIERLMYTGLRICVGDDNSLYRSKSTALFRRLSVS